MRANADVDSLVPRWYQQAKAHVAALFAADPDGPPHPEGVGRAAAGEPPPPAMAMVPEGRPGEARHEPIPLLQRGSPEDQAQLAAANRATWRLLEQQRLDPARPSPRGYRRTTDVSVSTTDPDATPMRHHPGDRAALGYHDHDVVDGGRHRIILAALVTPADVMENQAMLDLHTSPHDIGHMFAPCLARSVAALASRNADSCDELRPLPVTQGINICPGSCGEVCNLLWRVRFRWRLHPKRAVGDTTDGTIENIRARGRGHPRLHAAAGRRGPHALLQPLAVHLRRRARRIPADGAACNARPAKAACTASASGRSVHRSFYAEYVERVRGYHATATYRKVMHKRKVWPEPLFGEAKQWHVLRQFRLRGLANVNMEGLLIAAGQNLKRWLAVTGWGRRHGPSGSLAAVAPANQPGLRVI